MRIRVRNVVVAALAIIAVTLGAMAYMRASTPSANSTSPPVDVRDLTVKAKKLPVQNIENPI